MIHVGSPTRLFLCSTMISLMGVEARAEQLVPPSAYDPAPSLAAQLQLELGERIEPESGEDLPQQSTDEVSINGKPYLKFDGSYGTIVVPRLDRYDSESLERGNCTASTTQPRPERVMLAKGEISMQRNVKIYAEEFTNSTRGQCRSGLAFSNPQPLIVRPEIGIAYQDNLTQKKLIYRIFAGWGLFGVRLDW